MKQLSLWLLAADDSEVELLSSVSICQSSEERLEEKQKVLDQFELAAQAGLRQDSRCHNQDFSVDY